MIDANLQAKSAAEGRHLLLYDGVCGLCSRLVQFVLAHDHEPAFLFASLQSATGRAILERSGDTNLTALFVIANYQTSREEQLTKGRAALFVMCTLGWPWKVARLLNVLPPTLLDSLYDLIARNRYRVFGRATRCMMPRPEYQNRFVDL
jgi:predicted DCC family thiol-disulfide oxidoreductase YuxK